jgi:putative multiple sugar transport system permease protein
VGTVPGAIIGGLLLGVLNNGMSLLGIGTDIQ